MIKFQFNRQKAIETVLYLSNKEYGISRMRLLKYIFFADLYHLNKYGRPILGDYYVAMKNGPVLSKLYNLIKKSCDAFDVVDDKLVMPKRSSDLEYLSASDIEALEYAFNQYSQYRTFDISDMTHEIPEWVMARTREPKSNNPKMYWENMIEDEELKEKLMEYSGAIVF